MKLYYKGHRAIFHYNGKYYPLTSAVLITPEDSEKKYKWFNETKLHLAFGSNAKAEIDDTFSVLEFN